MPKKRNKERDWTIYIGVSPTQRLWGYRLMPTLRQLFKWALETRSCGGVRTIWPQRVVVATRRTYTATLAASTRRAGQCEQYPPLRRAMDVLIVVEACDRTSYLVPALAIPDELQQEFWDSIPQALLCLDCRVRRYPSKTRTKRCPRCGGQLEGFKDLIGKDEKAAAAKLNAGGIKVVA